MNHHANDPHTLQFKSTYQNASYYKPGQTWDDYEPAYAYGQERRTALRERRWDDVESDLELGWEKAKARSRLAWADAREAVREGWHKLERAMPGDADRDGR